MSIPVAAVFTNNAAFTVGYLRFSSAQPLENNQSNIITKYVLGEKNPQATSVCRGRENTCRLLEFETSEPEISLDSFGILPVFVKLRNKLFFELQCKFRLW